VDLAGEEKQGNAGAGLPVPRKIHGPLGADSPRAALFSEGGHRTLFGVVLPRE
jgi:hypothetical protein